MKVILTEKVPSLGNIGEIVNVSAGHARNYLLPQKLAVIADENHQKELEHNKRQLQKKIDEQKNIALEIKKKIDQLQVELIKKVGANSKLFGSVTNTELAKELALRDIQVERRTIHLETPIKSLGNFVAKVKLFTDVEAALKIKVIMDPQQALEEKAKREEAEKRAKERKAKGQTEEVQEVAEGENADVAETLS